MLLQEIAPNVKRVAVLRNSALATGLTQFGAVLSAARPRGIELTAIDVRDATELQRVLAAFSRSPGGGLIVTASELAVSHRDLIVSLAAQHKLPAVYHDRLYAAAGGLIAYGPDLDEEYRLAAGYIDRILKGTKPIDLPVQTSMKARLVINDKAAKVLGLAVPPALLARADEVIE
jgi:putative ABC transport system substrate-binding protein